MSRRFLDACQQNDDVDDVYTIVGKQFQHSKNGDAYIRATIGDRTMTAMAMKFQATSDEYDLIPERGLIRVRGSFQIFNDKPQVKVIRFEAIDPARVDMADLLPRTKFDPDDMWGELCGLLGTLSNPDIAAIIEAVLTDQTLARQIRTAPAAMTNHHAYIGGLLEHTLNACRVADACCRFYPQLNRDLVVAGVFLHDLGKTRELEYEVAFDYSDSGRLLGHIVMGAMIVQIKSQKINEQRRVENKPLIPQTLVQALQHIVLSHHGKREFGSPVLPATPEALAVHCIENMDAKLTAALMACRAERAAGADNVWTDYLNMFSGRLYRPDVAAAQPGDAASPIPSLINPAFGEMNSRK